MSVNKGNGEEKEEFKGRLKELSPITLNTYKDIQNISG